MAGPARTVRADRVLSRCATAGWQGSQASEEQAVRIDGSKLDGLHELIDWRNGHLRRRTGD